MAEYRQLLWGTQVTIILLLLLYRGQVAVGFEQPVVVEPPGLFERSELDVLHVAPRASAAENLCLEEPDDRFGQGIVVRIAAAADGRLDACLGEPLGVADQEVLHPAVAVLWQTTVSPL